MDKEKIKNEFGALVDEVQDKIDYTKDQMKDGLNAAKGKMKNVRSKTDQYIVDNPEKAALISLGVGVGIGMLLSLAARTGRRRHWSDMLKMLTR